MTVVKSFGVVVGGGVWDRRYGYNWRRRGVVVVTLFGRSVH
jgi:hypothetical protein